MPLFKTINHSKRTVVYIWKIEESLEQLYNEVVLNDRSSKRVAGMKSESHIKGFLAVRKLLEIAGYTDFDLFYTEDGKPHLKDGKIITISHSFDFSVIAISNDTIGIDIEKNREKIKRIAHKFVGKEKEFLVEENLVEQLTVIWGAKESLFKIHPDGGLLFIEHLPIDEFNLFHKQTKGYILKEPLNESYSIYFDIFEGYSLVYATNDLPLF
ncbi:4'-phosphopantetheinyl transferase family protein [Pseudofulvibacter geojedonensis]|uniref:4'-phosphopantetheinyl transferase family protein n=1 Tax=Pseudofulvibacter geojedonensis TaxID=1123758 RepID=A0ABW3I1Y7_9FLAO